MVRFPVTVLQALAKRVVRKYEPLIVGVTGSVGKTSARDAAAAVLAAAGHAVRAAPKNYNNELGLPLAVLGATAPGANPLRWSEAYARGVRLLSTRDPNYPTHLVLEYAADHPGDIGRLLAVAKPTIGVVTAIAPAHLEFFGTVENVAVEKGRLVEALPEGGVAVLNADDPRVAALTARTRARVITYGFARGAMVRAHDAHVALSAKHEPLGVRWHLALGSDAAEIVTAGTLGRMPVMAALAGAAVGVALGVDFWTIASALSGWHPPAGRMRLLPGRGGALLIDDTYNSSPKAALEALDALADLRMSIAARRRATAVLGTMAELGAESDRLHREVGATVAHVKPSRLVTVGPEASAIADAAVAGGMAESTVRRFETADAAAAFLAPVVAAGDIVLIKGSQSARCERVTAALLAHPEDAPELLVRQTRDWQDRS